VRGFLELMGYYRKFIQSYDAAVAPLMHLWKEAFCWTPAVASTFDALKSALTSTPVLQLLDFVMLFIVNCDTSGSSFGAVLHQGVGPIAFFSRAISLHHVKLMTYERELIGLVKVVHCWRPYLWTQSFVVRTDHYNLKFLLDQRLSMIPHVWVSKLFNY
jgi:hypothetical protein